jgi:DNA mismatch endonuclease (patch repair protein)
MASTSPLNPRRANMQANRRRDTGPERRLRSLLHREGLRFRVDHRIGTGRSAPRPDIAFIGARVAVFVDGCFWHSCPDHGAVPRSNAAYWGPKLERNRARDRDNERMLEELGWEVERVWEHEDPAVAAARVARLVDERTAAAPA